MSKKKVNNYSKMNKADEKDNRPKEKVYSNPANSKVGKIIIVTLALLMAFGGLFSVIWLIVTQR